MFLVHVSGVLMLLVIHVADLQALGIEEALALSRRRCRRSRRRSSLGRRSWRRPSRSRRSSNRRPLDRSRLHWRRNRGRLRRRSWSSRLLNRRPSDHRRLSRRTSSLRLHRRPRILLSLLLRRTRRLSLRVLRSQCCPRVALLLLLRSGSRLGRSGSLGWLGLDSRLRSSGWLLWLLLSRGRSRSRWRRSAHPRALWRREIGILSDRHGLQCRRRTLSGRRRSSRRSHRCRRSRSSVSILQGLQIKSHSLIRHGLGLEGRHAGGLRSRVWRSGGRLWVSEAECRAQATKS